MSSPHIHSGSSVRSMMLMVIYALLPASLVSVWVFGWMSVLMIVWCMAGCLLFEAIALRLMGRSMAALGDGSAALTGLLLALTLPALLPWWMPLIGCFVAIILSKQVYGGLGYNPFNPALAARVVLLISFPMNMTAWLIPGTAVFTPSIMPAIDLYAFTDCFTLFFAGSHALGESLDAITMASPLGYVKTEWSRGIGVQEALTTYNYSYFNAFIGREAGSLGETSALALLVGGVFLMVRGTIRWHIPFSFLITVALLAAVFNQLDANHYAPPLFHLLAGGLMLCAFFMATDPVSSPISPLGQVVFGVGCGLLTWVIRTYGGYPEGAMFSVLLMNCAVPLIDHYCRPRVYGKGVRGA
ncbi:MAG: RnfABCDGE type electron transport complex subunit D [Mariprofundaceae bacterium]